MNLHNAKAESYLRGMKFFDFEAEWNAYLSEYPEIKGKLLHSLEDRFVEGVKAIDVFREAVEYIPRSLKGRTMQTYIARKLMAVLNEEKKSRVLDYGCGAGNMGVMFSQVGFEVDVLEVEGVFTDFLKWRVARHFLPITVLNETSELKQYDLVLLFNVLEHLMEPMTVLKRISDSLVSGGYLAMLFNTHNEGLDIVSMETWEKELKPFVLDNFKVVENTDNMVYQKK